jgi:hypothetical protein
LRYPAEDEVRLAHLKFLAGRMRILPSQFGRGDEIIEAILVVALTRVLKLVLQNANEIESRRFPIQLFPRSLAREPARSFLRRLLFRPARPKNHP